METPSGTQNLRWKSPPATRLLREQCRVAELRNQIARMEAELAMYETRDCELLKDRTLWIGSKGGDHFHLTKDCGGFKSGSKSLTLCGTCLRRAQAAAQRADASS